MCRVSWHCIEILKGLFGKLLVRLVKENFVKQRRLRRNKRICNDFSFSTKTMYVSHSIALLFVLFNPLKSLVKKHFGIVNVQIHIMLYIVNTPDTITPVSPS